MLNELIRFEEIVISVINTSTIVLYNKACKLQFVERKYSKYKYVHIMQHGSLA